MNIIEQLQESRKLAGLAPYTVAQQVDLAEKKLSGKDKEEFLAKMGKKSKKDDGVDGGSGEAPSKGAQKALDDAAIKGSVSGKKGVKMKKKVSEEMNDILAHFGADPLSDAQVAKLDEAETPEE